jgi:hypothetical protein
MATVIPASNPIVSPAVGSVTYNEWYLTQLIVKATPTTCPTIVHLHRASTDPTTGVVTLMPNGPGADISFTVDIFQQLTTYPAFGVALNAVLDAVLTYATAKNLL